MHFPDLIRDLAVILGVAAVVTFIFRRIKQALVLGYIVAGIMVAEYQKPVIDVFIQKVFVPEAHRDHTLIAKSLEKIAPLNQILEQHLQGRSYMVGKSFTLGDINVASVAKLCPLIGADLTNFPAIQSWVNRLMERPAALKVAELEKH
jgi:glutathione S-transferase